MVQAVAPPVGLVEVYSASVVVVATHSVVDGHEMLVNVTVCTLADVQAPVPPAGLVEVHTLFPSTMAQKVVVGQEVLLGVDDPLSENAVVVQLSPGLVTDVVSCWPRALAVVVSVSPPGVVVVISVPPRGGGPLPSTCR